MSQALLHDVPGEHTATWAPALVNPTASLVGIGYWRRAFSYLLDVPIFYAAMYGFGITAGPVLDYLGLRPNLQRSLMTEPGTGALLFDLLLGVTYFVVFEWQFGATLGKALTGLRVVSCSGRPISLGSACIRGFARLVDGVLFGAVAAANMRAPYQQRWGDKLADTMVVSVSDPGFSARRPWWRLLPAAVLYWVTCILLLCLYLIMQHPVVLGA